jgi:hypothetical protein
MNILNVAQYSDEWWLARKGRFTASDAQTISVAGAGLETLAWEKAAEMIMTDEQYLTVLSRRRSMPSMDFGSAQESFSRDWLSEKLNCEIIDGGIALFDDNTSFSADGFIGEKIGLEIKNHEPKIALRMFAKIENGIKNNIAPKDIFDREHYAQMQFSLLKSEFNKWIFAMGSDCWGDSLRYWEIKPDIERMDNISAGLIKGQSLINEFVNRILESNNSYMNRDKDDK